MDQKVTEHGAIPDWLASALQDQPEPGKRQEIEIKYVLPRAEGLASLRGRKVREQAIEQIYVTARVITPYLSSDVEVDLYDEWRIRKNNDTFTITGKGAVSQLVRSEINIPISEQEFAAIKREARAHGDLPAVAKTRYSFEVQLFRERILIEMDDFHEVAGKKVEPDFVYCELEVGAAPLARSLRQRLILPPDLAPFMSGLEVSGFPEFKNANLARKGFPAANFAGLLRWYRRAVVDRLQTNLEKEEAPEKLSLMALEALSGLERGSRAQIGLSTRVPGEEARFRQPLRELRFGVEDSLGRPGEVDEQLRRIDASGFGWLRDYQRITSEDPFLRLFAKPQVFRPGLGHNTTTTRGQHTLDVIACAQNIALQTGLNEQLVAAIAALHDLGHPAGGHIGEECLTDLSSRVEGHGERRFKHHVFSLSLADIFDFQLLREVQIGAFYHKSGGGKLMALKGKPQEYGVVRIADKVSYVPWDIHDGLKNGFLKKEEVPGWLYDVLGKDPLDWIHTMTAAIVEESAQLFNVSFSEISGDVFKAYKEARNIIFKYIHGRIDWRTLRVQYEMAFEVIYSSFPELDPIPILAYMTDAEIARVANFAESKPRGSKLTIQQIEDEGMGFSEIIKHLWRLRDTPGGETKIYYHHRKSEENIS